MKASIPIHPEVLALAKALDIELFVVGGVVRDYLFNQFHGIPFDPKDFDIATKEHPGKVLELLAGDNSKCLGIKALPIGESFGVVAAVFPSGNKYEIATFRKEWYDPLDGDGRHPDKVEFSTPQADAMRRDLTINSLFYNIQSDEIMDFVGTGIEDVKNRLIRPVGDPLDRFCEDKLRVIRLVRFFCRYGVGNPLERLNKETLDAISFYSDLAGVSGERIRQEFLAGLKQAKSPFHFIQSCNDLGLMPAIFPGLKIGKIVESRNIHIVLAALFCNEPANVLCQRLNVAKYGKDEIRHVKFLHELQNVSNDRIFSLVNLRNQLDDICLPIEKRNEAKAKLEKEVCEYCNLMQIDVGIRCKLLHFIPGVCALQFPNLEGKLLGQAIRNGINQEFIDLNVS